MKAYLTVCGAAPIEGVEKLTEIFKRFSRHHGRSTIGESLNQQEFRSVLAAMGCQLNRTESTMVFKYCDRNKDRLVNLNDLCIALKLKRDKSTRAGTHRLNKVGSYGPTTQSIAYRKSVSHYGPNRQHEGRDR